MAYAGEKNKEFFMRKAFRIFGITALVAAIIFSMAACDSGGDNGGVTEPVMELKFTNEQVYDDVNPATFQPIPFTGSIATVTSGVGGSGSITDGKLSFTIGEPTQLMPFENFFPMPEESNASLSPGDTLGEQLSLRGSSNEGVVRLNIAGTGLSEQTIYLFVDKDCTVTIPASTFQGISIRSATLRLNAGWNAVIMKMTVSGSSMIIEMRITTDFSTGIWMLIQDW